jgi:hypothetical protein
MGNAARKRERRSLRQTVRCIAEADQDLAIEHDDLLILARVDVQRQAGTTGLL